MRNAPDSLRAPIESGFEFNDRGVITSPAWLAYFTRGLTTNVNATVAAMNGPDLPVDLGRPQPRQNDGSGVTLPMPGRRVYPEAGMPPAGLRVMPRADFPPSAPRAQLPPQLALMSAVEAGRQRPIWLIADTTANRAKYPNGIYPAAAFFVETDRNAVYRDTGTAWVYVAGIYIDLFANRPATLGTNDAGFVFLASDTLLYSYWTGAAWVAVPVNTVAAGTYGDATHVAQPVVDANGRITGINSVAITPTGGPPTGSAGGDLSGTYPNPGVAKVNGAALPASANVIGTNGSSQIVAIPNPAVTTITVTPGTVAALPGSPGPGCFATVSNALAPVLGSAVAGGGGAFAAVCWNGSQWTVFSI